MITVQTDRIPIEIFLRNWSMLCSKYKFLCTFPETSQFKIRETTDGIFENNIHYFCFLCNFNFNKIDN